jgi:putative glutathione S-transferase
VNNESTEILVALNNWPVDDTAVESAVIDLYPSELKKDIQETIDWVYGINNGVYRCGFASAQKDYMAAAEALEQRMIEVEDYLGKNEKEGKRFLLTKDTITAADIRLFNTLVRMDEVYVCYFKCGFASLLTGKFPNLLQYTARVYNYGNIKECVFMDDIMNHYFTSHAVRNMYGIVPKSISFIQRLEEINSRL